MFNKIDKEKKSIQENSSDTEISIVEYKENFFMKIINKIKQLQKKYWIIFYKLFYNKALSCLVAFEMKIENFQPEYISKMDFYLEGLDRQEKKEKEKPSVGVILCSGKDDSF